VHTTGILHLCTVQSPILKPMWYQYLAAFFAGAFLSNFIPHFVHGVSGNKFPSPFSNPRGIGLSSARVNMLWALTNLVIGYLLFAVAPIDNGHPLMLMAFFAGIVALSWHASGHFTKKHKE
jgi:hypothetical protein